jgi:hypothetical protein
MANSTASNKEVKVKRHHPPSYYKYREENPTISIKLTKKTKDALDKARGKMSYSEFLKSLFAPDGAFTRFVRLRTQLASDRAALEKEKGDLAKIERFTVPCSECGKPMVFDNTDKEFWKGIQPKLNSAFDDYAHSPNCD